MSESKSNYIIVGRIFPSELPSKVKDILNENKVDQDSIHNSYVPVSLIKVNDKGQRKKIVDSLKEAQYNVATVKGNMKDFLENVQPTREELKGSTKTFRIYNLPKDITVKKLRSIIPEPNLIKLPHGPQPCLVTYGTNDQCSAAYDALQGTEFLGNKLKLQFFNKTSNKKPTAIEDDLTLRIGNLPFAIKEKDLLKHYKDATVCKLLKDKAGKFNGSCLLTFNSNDEYKDAMEMTNKGFEIQGRKVRLQSALSMKKMKKDQNGKEDNRPVDNLVLRVRNIPYTMNQVALLKKYFPKAAHIRLLKKNDTFNGVIDVRYTNEENKVAEMKTIDNLVIVGRKLILDKTFKAKKKATETVKEKAEEKVINSKKRAKRDSSTNDDSDEGAPAAKKKAQMSSDDESDDSEDVNAGGDSDSEDDD